MRCYEAARCSCQRIGAWRSGREAWPDGWNMMEQIFNKSSRPLCIYKYKYKYIYILFHVFRSFLHVTCAKVRFDVKYNREKGSGTNFAMTCNYDQV